LPAPAQRKTLDVVTEPFGPAQFDVIDVGSAGIAGAGRHRGWANVEVVISNGQEDRLAAALGWPSWRSRHVTGLPYPKQAPDDTSG
jgi:hypothetical protein